MRATIFTLLLALLIGCAASRPPVDKAAMMDSWIGSHVSKLIEQLGPPTQIDVDGKGGFVLTYRYNSTVGQLPGQLYRSFGGYSYTNPSEIKLVMAFMFYVNDQGKIYHCRIEDNSDAIDKAMTGAMTAYTVLLLICLAGIVILLAQLSAIG